MGFRFRKSISILPGVKLNISKSGVSTTIGKKGATLNLGSKGVKGTLGIPGSGLSYDKMLFKTNKKSERTDRYIAPNEFKINVEEDGTVRFLDRKGRIYEEHVSTRIKKEYREEILNDLQEYVNQLNANTVNILNINMWFGKNKEAFITHHSYNEARQGNIREMENWLEYVLSEIISPIKFSGSFDVECSNGIWLDIDLPEIEELETFEYKILSSAFRITKKEKTSKQLRKEYAYLVSLIPLLLSEILFEHLPLLDNLVISGYTQRLNHSNGQLEEQYIYSLLISKPVFLNMRLTHIDVIESLKNFQSVMSLNSNYEWKSIQPYYKE